jgi:DNA-binding CsgD family transcriptional regulator
MEKTASAGHVLDEGDHPLSSVLRGRDHELAVVGEMLGRVRSGEGGVLLIEGSAGMGKSRLLAEAQRMAQRLSYTVAKGAADPGEGVVEMAALMDVLAGGPDAVIDLSELRDPDGAPEQRFWLLHDLACLLEQKSADAPLLIELDDAHWADMGTASGLRTLPSRLHAAPIMWVIAHRSNEGSAEIRGALTHLWREGAERLVLDPLSEHAVAQVARDVMHAEPEASVLEIARGAHGSPFVLVELLTGMRQEGLVRIDGGRADLLEVRLPDRVRQTMQERLAGLSEAAQSLARVATSLGRRFRFGDLAKMLDQPPSTLVVPLQELIGAGLLIEDERTLSFQHDLIREAVRATVPPSAAQALDRQAVDVLLAGGASPVEVALQLAASAAPGDDLAIDTLLKAAEALAPTDPAAGAELGERALQLTPDRHPLRSPLVALTTVSLHAAGRLEEAAAFADTALRQVLPADQEAEVLLSIAEMFRISPDVRADAGRRALALPGLDQGIRSQHLARLVYNLQVGGRPQEARALLPEAEAAVNTNAGTGAAFALGLGKGGLENVQGHFAASLTLIETALRLGRDVGDHARERIATQFLCGALIVLDRVDEALQLGAEGAASAKRDRQAWAMHMFDLWRGRELQQLGRLEEGAALLKAHFAPEELLGAVGDASAVVALGRIALHTADGRLIRQTGKLARVMLAQTSPGVRRHAAWLLALQAFDEADVAGAREWLCALGVEQRKSILPRFPMDLTDEIQLVRIAVAADDSELAQCGVAAAERRASLNPEVRSVTATAAHARGLLHSSQDDLAEAVELFEQSPRLHALAAALEDLGDARAHSGQKPSGVATLDRALVLYDEVGASHDASRVRARLRTLGVRRRLVSPRRPDHGWAAMTDSELAVARLVAQGLTNRDVADRLFVSPHTVNSHLRQIFAKLQINSRVALTRLAQDHDQAA